MFLKGAIKKQTTASLQRLASGANLSAQAPSRFFGARDQIALAEENFREATQKVREESLYNTSYQTYQTQQK